MSTKVGLFVVESRKIKEEAKGKRQGLVLTEMMALLGIKSEYRYIRTQKELEEMVSQYYDSKFRYLHFSMHGVTDGKGKPVGKFSFALDRVTYDAFCKPLLWDIANKEGKRRLFISACHVMEDLIDYFEARNNSFVSIIFPSEKIETSVAPLAWATFYHNMFTLEKRSMSNAHIKENLNNVCRFFGVRFKAYFRKQNGNNQYEKCSIPR
jgi:hypothetical protein